MFYCEFCKIFKNSFFTEHLQATASKQVTVPLQCLQTAKTVSSCRKTGETILSNYWQNPKITATVHYFHYNSHHHYHYYHFHYHCKMHLYHLKNPLSISTEFCLLFTGMYFSFIILYFILYFCISYYTFAFLRPVKGVRINLRPSDIFQMFSLYL